MEAVFNGVKYNTVQRTASAASVSRAQRLSISFELAIILTIGLLELPNFSLSWHRTVLSIDRQTSGQPVTAMWDMRASRKFFLWFNALKVFSEKSQETISKTLQTDWTKTRSVRSQWPSTPKRRSRCSEIRSSERRYWVDLLSKNMLERYNNL